MVLSDIGWLRLAGDYSCVGAACSGVYSRVGEQLLVYTVLWGTAVLVYTVVWDRCSGGDSRVEDSLSGGYSRVGDSYLGGNSRVADSVWCRQSWGTSSLVFTVLWRLYVPEKAGEGWLVSLDSVEESVRGGSRFRRRTVGH